MHRAEYAAFFEHPSQFLHLVRINVIDDIITKKDLHAYPKAHQPLQIPLDQMVRSIDEQWYFPWPCHGLNLLDRGMINQCKNIPANKW
jgi:hypothetical protein